MIPSGPSGEREALRDSGLGPIGAIPWGSHVCMFYESKQDLIDTHVDYFQAGLKQSEVCIWAVSWPLTVEEARAALRQRLPSFDAFVAAGQIELVSGYEWYLRGDSFAPERITMAWHERRAKALQQGYAGLRASGNAFWFESDLWETFREYEIALDQSLEGERMIVLCTYPLSRSKAVDLVEVIRTHGTSWLRQDGQWEYLGTPAAPDPRWGGVMTRQETVRPLPGPPTLTARERTALRWMLFGASNKQAAERMRISSRTVEFHRGNVLRKMGVRTLQELLIKFR
jgi:DNA-binding CsgD family transcriptional regulator